MTDSKIPKKTSSPPSKDKEEKVPSKNNLYSLGIKSSFGTFFAFKKDNNFY